MRDEKVRDFTNQWLGQLGKLSFDSLSQDGQVDYILFKNYLEHDLKQLELRMKERAEAAPLVPFGKTILELDEARRELKPMEWPKVAASLSSLTREIADARKALESRPRSEKVKRAIANRAVSSVEGLRFDAPRMERLLRRLRPALRLVERRTLQGRRPALQGYSTLLRDRLGAGRLGRASRGLAAVGWWGGGAGEVFEPAAMATLRRATPPDEPLPIATARSSATRLAARRS